MNSLINKFLLAGDKFMPEMHLRHLNIPKMLVENVLKTKKEYKTLKKLQIKNIFTEMNYTKLLFNMIWLVEILKT